MSIQTDDQTGPDRPGAFSGTARREPGSPSPSLQITHTDPTFDRLPVPYPLLYYVLAWPAMLAGYIRLQQ